MTQETYEDLIKERNDQKTKYKLLLTQYNEYKTFISNLFLRLDKTEEQIGKKIKAKFEKIDNRLEKLEKRLINLEKTNE